MKHILRLSFVVITLLLHQVSPVNLPPVAASSLATPMLIQPLQNVTEVVAGGDHTCALTDAGGGIARRGWVTDKDVIVVTGIWVAPSTQIPVTSSLPVVNPAAEPSK